MRTTLPITQVYYTPSNGESKSKIMFESNGRLLYGFEGDLVENELQKVLNAGNTKVIFRKP